MKQGERSEDDRRGSATLFNRTARTRCWVTLCLLLVAAIIIWRAYNVLLLVLASVLMALVIGGISHWLCSHTKLSYRWSMAVVVIGFAGVFVGLGFLMAPQLAGQASQLQKDLPRALQQLEREVSRYEPGRQLLEHFKGGPQEKVDQALSKAAVAITPVLHVVGGFLVLLFVGLYFAADPHRYVNGVVRLFSAPKRARAKEVIMVVGRTLQRWLVGRLVLMGINAVVTSIGLWALQVPLALVLGILSGLLNFIPNFGPIIAAVPALLVAFLDGPEKALYVLIFYIVYQNIDGYILEPQVEKRTVSLPPALTILSQVLLGLLFGTMGVLLAAPVSAIILVMVKMLYLEDVLDEQVNLPVR